MPYKNKMKMKMIGKKNLMGQMNQYKKSVDNYKMDLKKRLKR